MQTNNPKERRLSDNKRAMTPTSMNQIVLEPSAEEKDTQK